MDYHATEAAPTAANGRNSHDDFVSNASASAAITDSRRRQPHDYDVKFDVGHYQLGVYDDSGAVQVAAAARVYNVHPHVYHPYYTNYQPNARYRYEQFGPLYNSQQQHRPTQVASALLQCGILNGKGIFALYSH